MVEFSVIIPFKTVDNWLLECLEHLRKQTFRDFETILLPDVKIKPIKGFRIIVTGNVKPARKRNIGVRKAKGRYIAFIDADAYPDPDWMESAMKHLSEKGVGILGGPNLVPKEDGRMQRAGDDVLSSPLGGGLFSIRYKIKSKKDVSELPSCNIFIPKKVFLEVGGFDESILTGEDAKLCFAVRNSGRRVVYSPDVRVNHHRRALFRPHLRQIWNYGRDKAKVIGMVPFRSRLFYFVPSVFGVLIALGILLSSPYPFYLVAAYLVIIILGTLITSPRRFFLVIPGIILTHITYGISFLYGLLKR